MDRTHNGFCKVKIEKGVKTGMEKKKAVAAASLSMFLLSSFALVVPMPPASASSVTHRYWVMGGMTCSISDLVSIPNVTLGDWTTPYHTRPPYLAPLVGQLDITFSDPWTLPGYGMIVNLTALHETYVGLQHVWYDETTITWYRLTLTLEEDGYGWIFLNATGDVDCYTFNNCTGVYWKQPSLKAGEKAADTGALPSSGPDGVAGTADDGFGSGTNDPAGSSIFMLPGRMSVDCWIASRWILLFTSPWPQVFTTGTAYDIVDTPGRRIDGRWNSTEGEPCEFLAGEDHPGWQVNYGDPKWNAYGTYACVWSALNVSTSLGPLDVIFQAKQRLVREDVLIADVNGDEVCNIVDIVIAALAFDSRDEGPGDDGIPGTGDDKPIADRKYDARGDLRPARGLVNIVDIVRIALDFDERLQP